MKKKILVIVGPTSSGKSELAIKLARSFNGEIISCDSRQIYKKMDLGTGKIEGKWKNEIFVYKNIPHHLIDFANPKKQFSAALFKNKAEKIINQILKRGHLPILCGGTGHWIDAVVYDQVLPDVKPNLKLRASLEKKSADELFQKLMKLDPARAKTIDKNNKRRLIRALEIILATGKPVPLLSHKPQALSPLWIGINLPKEELYKKIERRLKQRLKLGLVKEVEKLHKDGLSWKKLEEFGLEYKFGALRLQNKVNDDEMFAELLKAIEHYSKRQMTWWKKNKSINWITTPKEAKNLLENFLK